MLFRPLGFCLLTLALTVSSARAQGEETLRPAMPDGEDSTASAPQPAPPVPRAERPQPAPEADGDIEYRLLGYVRLEGSVVGDDPNVSFVGRNDGFRLQNARIGVEGTWKKRLTLRVSGDGAIDERDNPNAVEGRLRFALRDAYADVHFHPKAELRVARFKSLYDIEEATRTNEMTFIDRALSSRGTLATEGFESRGLGIRRNIGLALRSDRLVESGSLRLGYELSAQNGNGDLDAVNDNDALAYSAVMSAYLGEEGILLAGARYNSRTEGELPFRRTEDDLGAVIAARYWGNPLRVTAQLLYLRTKFPTTGGPDQNAYGAHAEALYTIPTLSWLEAGYRFAILDPSDLIPSDIVQEHTGGLNVHLPRYRMRVQLNYTHTIEETGRVLDNDRLEGLVQVSL